ncbi:MAG: UDP-glucose/GDP-mannose dehydrogenase family protein [Thermoplasmatales archaeon]|nr:UDP-glucose/GDP-mannose dehydrogenase family protein [Thermoplasmatales archaeon]
MKIGVIGLGVVGKATLDGFRCFGYDAWGYDIDSKKTEVEELLEAEIYFICTPETEVENAIAELNNKHLRGLIVVRSTMPPRTTKQLQKKYRRHISHNPEFIRARNALDDFMFPNRIVIGECCKRHGDLIASLYKHFNAPIIRVNTTTSELIKLVANAWLHTQVDFWNEVKKKCELLKVSPQVVANTVILDKRISKYGSKMTGGEAGGHCLPKDYEYWKKIK